MGKSIRSKAGKQWRAQRREKLSEWERQRTQDLHDRLIADVAAQDSTMRETREALAPVAVKKETITIEIEEDKDTDVRMLSVAPRIKKTPAPPRVTRSARR